MRIEVYAPDAESVRLVSGPASVQLVEHGATWVGEVPDGAAYQLQVDPSATARFDHPLTLVDPLASAVGFSPDHDRDAARPGATLETDAPHAIAHAWPRRRAPRITDRPLVVYEAHVRGMTMMRDRADRGTFAALHDELERLAALGVSVIELLPVHQYDPAEGNYWGYMPLVFGAVHHAYAAGDDANAELGELVAVAHEHDIEIWLDVVFNHTTEEDEHGPTYNLRALADREYYAVRADGSYVDEAGCGNIVDATSPAAQRLILDALNRFADLGVDGFRFDLASIVGRDPDFVRSIGDWAEDRGVRLVAEAWDVARYQVGRAWPDQRWMQWNDRFRDDMRGFLRGEAGLVPSVMQRVQGSPDVFDHPSHSVNFINAHDGFTLYDLVSYDRKHNEANGWNGTDGTDNNRSWNCGWEGDEGVPQHVTKLRRRQMRNAMLLLMLSHGTPMFVAGDEFARTQGGNNNPYNQDTATSWIDWSRQTEFADLEQFVAHAIRFRQAHDVLDAPDWWGERIEWFGTDAGPDTAEHSRTLAWHLDGLYVMANMWWEPLDFAVQVPGPWHRAIDTTDERGFVDDETPVGAHITVGPRSIVVLTT